MASLFLHQANMNYRYKIIKTIYILICKLILDYRKRYLEESVHVLLSFKREIFEGST